MTKRELVVEVAEHFGYTQNEVSDVIQGTLDAVVAVLSEGNRLEIRNFGVFELKTRDARMGRNPRTGDKVPIEAKRVATFKPGKALKELVKRRPADSPSAQSQEAPATPDRAEPLGSM